MYLEFLVSLEIKLTRGRSSLRIEAYAPCDLRRRGVQHDGSRNAKLPDRVLTIRYSADPHVSLITACESIMRGAADPLVRTSISASRSVTSRASMIWAERSLRSLCDVTLVVRWVKSAP